MITRREALQVAAATAALALAGAPAQAAADAKSAMAEFLGGVTPDPGGITLDLAATVEDGNSVPFAVAVESPMQPDSYVSEVLVVGEGNPWPRVAAFQFSPLAGKASFSTRIRLAESQNVVVLARHSDGRIRIAQQHVEVTIGACSN